MKAVRVFATNQSLPSECLNSLVELVGDPNIKVTLTLKIIGLLTQLGIILFCSVKFLFNITYLFFMTYFHRNVIWYLFRLYTVKLRAIFTNLSCLQAKLQLYTCTDMWNAKSKSGFTSYFQHFSNTIVIKRYLLRKNMHSLLQFTSE